MASWLWEPVMYFALLWLALLFGIFAAALTSRRRR